jgi:hypothetical protein
VALAAKHAFEGDGASVTILDGATGRVVDLDLRGTDAEVAARYAAPTEGAPKRGRPKLGVVAREVTLLPRHWDWLAAQPGGASVALRKLVEAARKAETSGQRSRVEVAYRFMSTLAGDLPNFEEASRALFAVDLERLDALMSAWSEDVTGEVRRALAAPEDPRL